MDITSATSTQFTGAAQNAPNSTEATSAGTKISSDFETFLKMLTVQMENQDPLNPIESSDYAVQLATFSGVEQQVKTNDLLQALSGQFGAMSMSDLAGWVGMEARAVSPVRFENQPVTLAPDPASGADKAFVLVRDRYGTTLDRFEISVTDDKVVWDGKDAGGSTYPPGQYTFYLQSLSQDLVLGESQIAVYAPVTEARVENGETILVLEGGIEVPATEVDALRAPRGAS